MCKARSWLMVVTVVVMFGMLFVAMDEQGVSSEASIIGVLLEHAGASARVLQLAMVTVLGSALQGALEFGGEAKLWLTHKGLGALDALVGLTLADVAETLEHNEDDIFTELHVAAVSSWNLVFCMLVPCAVTYWVAVRDPAGPGPSVWRRQFLAWLAVLGSVYVCWAMLRSQERISRVRLMQRAGAEALNRYIHGRDLHRYRLGDAPALEVTTTKDGRAELFESAHWLNAMVAGAWMIEDGGVGQYVSENIANSLKEELSRVPRDMGALELKRFTLGSTSPTLFGLRTGKIEADEGPDGEGRPEQLWADLDFIYFAGDMGIELSLQPPNLNIALPDKAVQVSSLYLSGGLRLTMNTTPTYPFVGNASVAFLTLPALDMGVSTFGGVDLSSVPILQGWVNSTLFYVIQQMTYPHAIEFDMGSIICPNCYDDVVAAPKSAPKILVDVVLGLGGKARRGLLETFKRVTRRVGLEEKKDVRGAAVGVKAKEDVDEASASNAMRDVPL